METLTSTWGGDLNDLTGPDHEMSCLYESQFGRFSSPPPLHHPPLPHPLMWAEPLSPHLQRNKQLQDALLQREEELLRLQEENVKLREFLESSKARKLQLKAKRLKTSQSDVRALRSKRVCRNLTPQLSAAAAPAEPGLDLWVLRTLGLKDADTIDTTQQDCRFYASRILETRPGETAELASSRCPLDGTAFSMSLSPSSSVRTHSFSQGQAFVRRDQDGCWNFTWVPKQEP